MVRHSGFRYAVIAVAILCGLVLSLRWHEWFTGTYGLWLSGMMDSTADEHNPISDAQFRFLVTPDGIIPEIASVPLGSTVEIFNDTSEPVRIMSDPHPSHTDVVSLNTTASTSIFSSVQFTASTTGTFGFHDDTHVGFHGVIRVYDPDHPTPDISKTKARQEAMKEKLIAMFVATDSESIVTVINAIKRDPVLTRDCHNVAHDLGHYAYELYGFSGAMLYTGPDKSEYIALQNMCAGGYVHGIMEEVFLHQPDLVKTPGVFCESVPKINRDSCFHGVGHAVMFVHERALAPSVHDCKQSPTLADTARCFEGIFMELFWGDIDHFGDGSLGFDEQKPFATCSVLEPIAKPACYIYAPFGYLRSHDGDYVGVTQLCITSNLDDSDQRFCLRGVGLGLTNRLKVQDLTRVEAIAIPLSVQQKHYFYEGVIGYARFSGLPEADIEATCTSLVTDTEICNDVRHTYPR